MDDDSELALSDVVNICNTIDYNFIEIQDNPFERPKNVDFIDKYGITHDEIRDIIHDITIEDYYSGPDPDTNPKYPIPFWKFLKKDNTLDVILYIKIKIINHKRKVIVFSIHEEGIYD